MAHAFNWTTLENNEANMQQELSNLNTALINFKRALAFAISPELKSECDPKSIKKAFECGFKAARKHSLDTDSQTHFKNYLEKHENKISKAIDTKPDRY